MIKKIINRLLVNLNNFKRYNFLQLNDTSNLDEDHVAIQTMAYEFANQKLLPFAEEWD